MKTLSTVVAALLACALAVAALPAQAAGGAALRLESAPEGRFDAESLQRGARTFVNYCLNCHSAKYMRYNRLQEIGLTEAQIRDNLMFATEKIGDTMQVAMLPADAKAWFGTAPPDLSVEARVRGREWLYNYFLGFYRDESTPSGWNNLVFPNVAMPHVLVGLSGTSRLVEKEFDSAEAAERAAFARHDLMSMVPGHGHKVILRTLAEETPGALSRDEYRATVRDLVNFLEFVAEPAKRSRTNVGVVVVLWLGLLFVFAYWLKREYWSDVH